MKRRGFASRATASQRQAEAAFKQSMMVKPPSDEDIAKKAFDDNRERLKAARLARDAQVEAKS
jgi:hypothetical protein